MIDALKTINMSEHFNLHLIKSKKFRTDLISVYFLRPLTIEEATLNTLLTRILDQGCEKYPSATQLVRQFDNLYGTAFVSDIAKVGERHQVQIKIQFPRSVLIEQNLMEACMALLSDIIYRPLLENGSFKTSIFETEKQKLIQEIESKINDKTTYAVDRCFEIMCEEEPFRFYAYGDIDYLNTVTPEILTAHYKDVISNSQMDVIILGDFDFDETQTLVKHYFESPKGAIEIPEEKILAPRAELIRVTETMQISQAKMVIGYRTQTDRFSDLYYPLHLFTYILGGMPSSKLFMSVREKESLCYYVGSKMDKLKGIVYTILGIDAVNAEKAETLIDEEMRKMTEGGISDEDLRVAKLAISSSLKSVSDFPNSYSNFFYNQFMLDDPIDIDHYIECFERVTKEEVAEVGKRIVKEMVYLLKGSE